MRKSFIPNGLIELALMKEDGLLYANQPLRLSAGDAVQIILEEVRQYQSERTKKAKETYR